MTVATGQAALNVTEGPSRTRLKPGSFLRVPSCPSWFKPFRPADCDSPAKSLPQKPLWAIHFCAGGFPHVGHDRLESSTHIVIVSSVRRRAKWRQSIHYDLQSGRWAPGLYSLHARLSQAGEVFQRQAVGSGRHTDDVIYGNAAVAGELGDSYRCVYRLSDS